MLETGEHVITLAVEGPPNRSGEVSSDMRPARAVIRIYVAKRPDHYWFWTPVGLAVLGMVCLRRALFGNLPRQWRLYASNLGDSRRKPRCERSGK